MLPSIEVRINNLIKSLEETILPAVNSENSLALEQAALVIGHLKVISLQWDSAYLFERGSLFQIRDLALSLIACANSFNCKLQEALILKNTIDDIPKKLPLTVGGINPYILTVGDAIDRFINASFIDVTDKFNHEVSSCIQAYGNRQALRERSWFQSTGLDLDEKELMSINQILKFDSEFELKN